ncbi:MAG: GH36 C-terminal domain-containing protein [Firmicutes bacterium]|nr:GH36 C-terminal domain-containing protein [Bacillota bacterium]
MQTIETADIRITIEAGDNLLRITELGNKADRYNWIEDGGWDYQLMSRVRVVGSSEDSYLNWIFDAQASSRISSEKSSIITLVYRSTSPILTLTSVWEAKDNDCGPVEHSMYLTNNSGQTVTIYQPESLDLAVTGENALWAWYVHKGSIIADHAVENVKTSELTPGYHRDLYTVVLEHYGNYIPWLSLNDVQANRGLYIGWEWPDGRIQLSCAEPNSARVLAGLGIPDTNYGVVNWDDPDTKPAPILEFKTDLEPGETFEVPKAFVGAYSGVNTAYATDFQGRCQRLVDDGCNQMRRWLFQYCMPEINRRDITMPEVEYSTNHSIGLVEPGEPVGGTPTQIGWLGNDGRKLEAVVKDLHDLELGFDTICIDNGWTNIVGEYNNEPLYWPAPDPGSAVSAMRQYSDMVQEKYGFKRFQLYFVFHDGHSVEPGALSTRNPKGEFVHPEWFRREQVDRPDAENEHTKWFGRRRADMPSIIQDRVAYSERNADLGNSECLDTVKKLVAEKLVEYNVNSIKLDYGPIIVDSYYQGAPAGRHRYGRLDTCYWAAKGFHELMEYLYQVVPDFKCQLNDCGGNLKNYGSSRYASVLPVRDDGGYNMTPEECRTALYQSLYCFPAMQLMLPFAGDYAVCGAYRYRSWMMAAPFTMTEAPADMGAEEIDILRSCIQSYKENVRPLVRNGNVYHILPQARLGDWDGIEYYDSAAGRGVAMLFKGTDETGRVLPHGRNVKLRGLESEQSYALRFEDGSNQELVGGIYTGEHLMAAGLDLCLGEPDQIASEWMFFERCHSRKVIGDE